MIAFVGAALTFVCLVASALLPHVAPSKLREEETVAAVRLIAGIFVVMASLLLGLLVNSARAKYETIDHNVHAFATNVILLDRTMRALGPEGETAHRELVVYVKKTLADEPVSKVDAGAETLLNQVGASLRATRVTDPQKTMLWDDALGQYRQVVQQRWVMVEESEGSIPMLFVAMVVIWLMLIFAGFGLQAPRNHVVVTAFVLSALAISASIYLILDFDSPFTGLIQVTNEPLKRALVELERPIMMVR